MTKKEYIRLVPLDVRERDADDDEPGESYEGLPSNDAFMDVEYPQG